MALRISGKTFLIFMHFLLLNYTVLGGPAFATIVAPFEESDKKIRLVQQNQKLLAPDGQCAMELWSLESKVTHITHPLDFQGHWVSNGCETHAGPKFMLRDYQFYKGGNFLLRQYHYDDDHCSKPAYAVLAHGNIIHSRRSWLVPSANDVTFSLKKATVVPYSKTAAKTLTHDLRSHCAVEDQPQPFDWPWLHEHKEYLIYYRREQDDEEPGTLNLEPDQHPSNAEEGSAEGEPGLENDPRDQKDPTGPEDHTTAELDCLTAINGTMLELQLMRMDEVKMENGFYERRLLTGMPIFERGNRTWLAPTSFSVPMVNAYEVLDCKTCEKIKNSNPISPPRFRPANHQSDTTYAAHQAPPTDTELNGDWLSTECESHPHGMYALRQMSFYSAEQEWSLRQRHFNDPACKHPSFTLMAQGHYTLSTLGVLGTQRGHNFNNTLLPNTEHIVYKIESVQLVPESRSAVLQFRQAHRCGGPSVVWRRGRKVDLTQFGGCSPLGIIVPSFTRDIVKTVAAKEPSTGQGRGNLGVGVLPPIRTLLYTGDYTTVQHGGGMVLYPTAFMRPMQKCDDVISVVLSVSLEDQAPEPGTSGATPLRPPLFVSPIGSLAYLWLTIFVLTVMQSISIGR